jgi:hypothetical protein
MPGFLLNKPVIARNEAISTQADQSCIYDTFLFSLYSIEIASFLAMTR